ncbi:MAG: YndJ family transporter [Polyangiaceae bacterium]|nr:YndJ family transporter [Polyangiaceae bacterium]
MGYRLLRRALGREKVLAEEVALALAWVFVGGGLVWLSTYLRGEMLLGFTAPWTWLAAAHFGAAGFGALTITALTCRAISDARALSMLRPLLLVHPAAYLVTAAGISGVELCNMLGAVAYEIIFVTQLGAFLFGRPDRIAMGPRLVVGLSLIVPVVTLVPSLAWAWGAPLFDLSGMIRYHGLVNAIGHVGVGLVAFGWGRPEAHSPLRT